jgi:hypothetical protein
MDVQKNCSMHKIFGATLARMKRLVSFWLTILFGSDEPLYTLRLLALSAFIAIAGMMVAHVLHKDTLSSILAGMSLALCCMLVDRIFRLGSVEYKRDPRASEAFKLDLSR